MKIIRINIQSMFKNNTLKGLLIFLLFAINNPVNSKDFSFSSSFSVSTKYGSELLKLYQDRVILRQEQGEDYSYKGCDKINLVKGKSFSSKPNLKYRLSGCNNVFVPIPKNNNTAFLRKVIKYLEDINLNVIVVPGHYFEEKVIETSTINSYQLNFDFENALSIVERTGSNDLLCIIDSRTDVSSYSGIQDYVYIRFYDYHSRRNWQWNFHQIKLPNSSTSTIIRTLKQEISSDIHFNKSAKIYHNKNMTCWNESKINEYFENSNYKKYEGVYENTSYGIKYKVAVKQIRNMYYLIYLSSDLISGVWDVGEVLAKLNKTATNGFYKADWYNNLKILESNYYVSFNKAGMNVIDPDKNESFYVKLLPYESEKTNSKSQPSSGTGFAICSNGLIVTNNHVIENAKTIKIRGVNGDFNRTYSAKTIITDNHNDLAIIMIDDYSFSSFGEIPFMMKTSKSDVGEDIFVLGYPLRASMGDEVKLTNGIISSNTGFQGDITSFQISAPIQPGNSGGPLFNSSGELIGIINAKHLGAENASYGVKVSYLQNLIDMLEHPIDLPKNNFLYGKKLSSQVSIIKKFVLIIEVD